MKNKISTLILILGTGLIIILAVSLPAQEVQFSGDISTVSTYVWRGIKANNGPALQGTALFTYSFFTLGLWCSSVNFGDDKEVETDLYAEIVLPTGNIVNIITTNNSTMHMILFDKFFQFKSKIMKYIPNKDATIPSLIIVSFLGRTYSNIKAIINKAKNK